MQKKAKVFLSMCAILIVTAMLFTACSSSMKDDPNRNVAGGTAAITWPMLSFEDLQLASKIAYRRHITSVKALNQGEMTKVDLKIVKLSEENKAAVATDAEMLKKDAIQAKVKNFFEAATSNPIVVNTDRTVSTNPDRIDGSKDQRHELRVTSWNIERGQRLQGIKDLMSYGSAGVCDRSLIKNQIGWKSNDDGKSIKDYPEKLNSAIDEICALNQTDVLILNEADFGVCRSNNSFVASELADHLGMNFTFAPNFIEIEPSKTGVIPNDPQTSTYDPYCKQVDPRATRNLIGNAILSRFPIKNVQVVELPIGKLDKFGNALPTQPRGFFKKVLRAIGKKHDITCWDWHEDEIKAPTVVDKGIRVAGKLVYKEVIRREMRYGQRSAIIADLDIGDGKEITVVNAHLENKATPACRLAQMNFLLNAVTERAKANHSHNPIILGGDLNTSGQDGSSHPLGKTVYELGAANTIMNVGFMTEAFGLTLPFGVNQAISGTKFAVSYLTTTQNPTRKDIFWFRPSPEGKLFSSLQKAGYRNDATAGDANVTLNPNYTGSWAATNSRDDLGFEASHFFNRTFATWGATRLDWLFVNKNKNECVQPRFPRTLGNIRQGLREDFPSDHVPITMMYGYKPNCIN